MATSPELVLQSITGIAYCILRHAVTLAALGALTVGIQAWVIMRASCRKRPTPR